MKKYISLLVLSILLMACAKKNVFVQKKITPNPFDDLISGELVEEVYLIGDVGADSNKSRYALGLLKKQLETSIDSNTTVIFLGDNIYPRGLHEEGHILRKQDEKNINDQINVVKDFDGEIVFIPGNHDWDQGRPKGFEMIKRQEDYIQEKLKAKVFHPSDGCAGPKEINVTDNLTLVLIDTQWWLHQHKKGRGKVDDCNTSTKEEFLREFQDILKKNRDKNVIVAGHHPLFSNGRHGGYYVTNDFLFPLRQINTNFVLPLPLVGVIYPFYRSVFGNIQDIPNPVYQDLKKNLVGIMNQFDNIVYAAGHEHNLQYFKEQRTHYVVSGSGSKLTPVRYNYRVDFAALHKGFAKLEYYENGQVFLKYFAGDMKDGEDSLLFERKIYTKKVKEFEEVKDVEKKSYKGMYATVIPDSNYEASKFKRIFFGDLNREIWTKPIKVPYLDIHYEKGGLYPVEKGGGQQTVSLKMKGRDGKEYKLRGVKKSADYLVNRDLRGTLAQDIIYDGIAGSHPYGSLAVPKMAKAAGIYYIEPKLVYIPKDSILGDYITEFGGMFALFEIHPDDNMRDMPEFGNSKEVLNYNQAIEELEQHQDHVVDVDFTVKSRMFDMLIGDWDRHDDQWRWGTYKVEDKTIYRPIPRDRDQVFFKFDGVVMKIANRKWLLRKFQPFKKDVRDIAGLNYNARYFDRYFLTEANKETWIRMAQEIQNTVTDDVIEAAVKDLPEEAFKINGNELIDILKARREKLVEFAERYYEVLATTVHVLGTTKEDYFDVKRKDNGDVEVSVYPREKGKKVEEERFYYRLFKKDETKEIVLYGMGNDDEYKVKGKSDESILVRIVAGNERDRIEDKSEVSGWRKLTKVYEVEGKDSTDEETETSSETSVTVLNEGEAYFANRRAFRYNNTIPLPSIGFNQDDGFFIGPGVIITRHGFEKKPYLSFHKIYANYATKAEGYNFFYENLYVDLFGKYDFGFKADINSPLVYQFYGLGNETDPPEEIINNSPVRIENIKFDTRFTRANDTQTKKLFGNIGYQFVLVKEVMTYENVASFDPKDQFLSLSVGYEYTNTEAKINPKRGLKYNIEIGNTVSTTKKADNFVSVDAEMSVYFPFYNFKKQTNLAFRIGYSGNFGDYEFYQANFLSGLDNLRGIGRNRFAGDAVFYNNAEFRKSLTKVDNYIVPFDLGFLIHGDIGKVYFENENSDKWHTSYGAGVFINILDFFGLTGTYSISDVDSQFLVGTNLYF